MSMTTAAPPVDERVAHVGLLRRLLVRPELASVIGAIVVFVFFSAQSPVFSSAPGLSNWLEIASTYGIMAVAVGLLMIGGEFDISAGVMTGTVGLTIAILATKYRWELSLATGAPPCHAPV